MSTKEDYYKILGVSREASSDEIKRAYRKSALECHPDRCPDDPQAEQKFKNASEAYQVLSDPEKRRLYDTYGHEGLDRSGFHGFNNMDDIFSSFGDLFSDFFGGGFAGFSRAQGPRAGRSHKVVVEMTLREAARGVTKKIELTRQEPCAACHGTGGREGAEPQTCAYCRGQGRVIQSTGWFRVATVCPRCSGEGRVVTDPCGVCRGSGLIPVQREVEVNIPAGVETGQQMRMRGEGSHGEHGMPAGDLYVAIEVMEHALFHREGQHLVFEMPVSFVQAALGDEVEVPTIRGKATLRIPPGTQSDTALRLKGEGMPEVHSERRGDQVVIVHVETPRKLSAKQRDILKEFAKTEDLKVHPQRRTFLEKVKDYFAELKIL